MPLSEVQIGHRLRENRLRTRQGCDIRGTIVVRQRDRRRRWRWDRRADGASRWRRRRGLLVGHDERQIDRRQVVLRPGWFRRCREQGLELRVRQPLDHEVLRRQFDLLLNFDSIGARLVPAHGVEVHRAVERLEVLGRAPGVERSGGPLFRVMLDQEVRARSRRGVGHEAHDRLRGLRGARHRRPCLRPRERLRRVAVHGIGRQQAAEPVHLLAEPSAALGDFCEDPERQHVFWVEGQHLPKHVGGAGIVLLVDQATPVNDVRADIIGV